jgi:hypothetical protein
MKKLVIDGNKIKLYVKLFSGLVGIVMGLFEIFSAYKSYKAGKQSVLNIFKK